LYRGSIIVMYNYVLIKILIMLSYLRGLDPSLTYVSPSVSRGGLATWE
jgi:hypothetical protein